MRRGLLSAVVFLLLAVPSAQAQQHWRSHAFYGYKTAPFLPYCAKNGNVQPCVS